MLFINYYPILFRLELLDAIRGIIQEGELK